jgi:Predicted hydrolase (metallo-beta-lactamase superfamily)
MWNKNKFKFRIISLLIIVLMLISSCGKQGNATGPAGNNANPTAAAGQNNSAAKKANRYDEVFDASQDAGKLVIRFLYTKTGTDTKSGDSTIIKTPDGKVILIDGSAPETASTLIKYFDSMGITKIDAIVASHPHIDHVGGLTQIINKYPVGKVYRSGLEYPTQTNKDFLKAIEDKKIETVILKDGMSFDFGDTKIDVYSPVGNFNYPTTFPDGSTQFINDNSVVLKITYKDAKILMPGDLYITGESELLSRHGNDLQADILKMPHHGDNTSSSPSFIKAVQPKIAVAMYDRLASLDTYNSYRHDGAKAYITAVDGNVKIVADGTRDYKIVTEKDRESDFLK